MVSKYLKTFCSLHFVEGSRGSSEWERGEKGERAEFGMFYHRDSEVTAITTLGSSSQGPPAHSPPLSWPPLGSNHPRNSRDLPPELLVLHLTKFCALSLLAFKKDLFDGINSTI